MLRRIKSSTRKTLIFSAIAILIAVLFGILILYVSHVSESSDGNMGLLAWGLLLSVIMMLLVPFFLVAAIFNAIVVFTEPNNTFKVMCGVMSLVFIFTGLFLLNWLL
ncbi:TPA: hypothetical protein DEW05_05430 [Candidatus Saccharibacteria bacterium]|nr:hypothetical protein [Candidatus Saccharibacteria bacterium]